MIKNAAFTVIELLIVVVITGILITFAISSYQNIISNKLADTEIVRLHAMVHLARTEAVLRGEIITLCGSSNKKTCDHEWSKGQLLFIDKKGNGQFNPGDEIIQLFPPIKKSGQLEWNAFPIVKYLQFHPTGYSNYQNGTFKYCPTNKNAYFARAIFISKSGRIRLSKPNADGMHVDSRNQPLICD